MDEVASDETQSTGHNQPIQIRLTPSIISRGQVGSFPRGSIVCPWECGFHCRVLLCRFRLCCLLSCMERLSCNDPLLSNLQSLHAESSHYSQYSYRVPHTLHSLRHCLPR